MTAILMNTTIGTTTSERNNNDDDNVKSIDGQKNFEKKDVQQQQQQTTNDQPPQPAPIPLLKGTLSYNVENRKHFIRGMWNYENIAQGAKDHRPQRFELLRTLSSDEDPTVIPANGEFHGSFSVVYIHKTSKGKIKERSQVVSETGVQLNFDRISDGEYTVKGKGNNHFGVFQLIGKATKVDLEGMDISYTVEMRKTYLSSTVATAPVEKVKKKKNSMKRKQPSGELPNVSESYPTGVVCLRGKLSKQSMQDVGGTQVIHKITGIWSSGLDIIQSSPQVCQSFDYEHRASSGAKPEFPHSARYSGWFILNGEEKTKIQEKDLQLKFIPNNKGYHNIVGKGWNAFGKYSLSGALEKDFTITIFRHFNLPKQIAPVKEDNGTNSINATKDITSSATISAENSLTLTLDDVMLPNNESSNTTNRPHSITPPSHGSYSAVSRGTLKINEDGTHTCTGKWAITREHYSSGQTSNFHFGLESTDINQDGSFPMDARYYKGSFKMRRGSAKYTSIIDRQIVLKFILNNSGSYNVHGVGVNSIGKFTLIGTLISSSSSAGQVELYRMYPISSSETTRPITSSSAAGPPKKSPSHSISSNEELTQKQIRSSSRTSKPPIHLSEDNPIAIQQRMYDKCIQIHSIIKEKDSLLGAFFAFAVDPVKLNIPNYYTIISHPMDLQTVEKTIISKKENNFNVKEFETNMRLIFENAMKYNEDTTHAVHIAARQLLTLFCMKYKDVERDEDRLKAIQKKNSTTMQQPKQIDSSTMGSTIMQSNKRNSTKNSSSSIISSRGKELPTSKKSESNSIINKSRKRGSSNNDDNDRSSNKRSKSDYVTRAEFEVLKQQMKTMQLMLESFQKNLNKNNNGMYAAHVTSNNNITSSSTGITNTSKQQNQPPPQQAVSVSPVENKPLTLQEQEVLTESINSISPDKLPGVIQIIRESTKLNGDEEEIDLEIDQLDTATQRKLQRFVLMNVVKRENKSRRKGGGGSEKKKKKGVSRNKKDSEEKKSEVKRKASGNVSKNATTASSKEVKTSIAPTSANNISTKPDNESSFFSFGSKGLNQDSDDDDDSSSASSHELPSKQSSSLAPIKKKTDKEPMSSFLLPDDPKDSNFSSDDSDNEGSKADANKTSSNWNKMATTSNAKANNNTSSSPHNNIQQPNSPGNQSTSSSSSSEDPLWSAARNQSEKNSSLEHIRTTQKQKLLQSTTQKQQENYIQSTTKLKTLSEEKAAHQKSENEKKDQEVQNMRKQMRQSYENVEATVDLEEQRDMMKKYEQSLGGGDYDFGSNSPSSDFGF